MNNFIVKNFFLKSFILLLFCYLLFNKKNELFIPLNYVGRPISKIKKYDKNEGKRKIYSRPNKCFSCEKQILASNEPHLIHMAFPTKCFSCEKNSKKPYYTGPTKCFNCD